MFLQHRQPSPSQICFYKRWSIQMKTSLFKDSFPWGREKKITNRDLKGWDRSIELALPLKDPSLPSPSHWHGSLIEQKLHLYCYSYENKNLNIFLITFLLGRERLLIMQRSVVTVSDKGVRWESNTHFGDWREASGARGEVRVAALWQKGEIRSDNKGEWGRLRSTYTKAYCLPEAAFEF